MSLQQARADEQRDETTTDIVQRWSIVMLPQARYTCNSMNLSGKTVFKQSILG